MAEIEDIEIKTGDLTFRGRAAGRIDGRLVLLLHGFPQTSRCWLPTLAALGDEGYRAVAFDQRGYSPGARPEGVEQYSLSHLIADVIAVADDIGGHSFDLVGHDWGAVVAWYLAGQYASRVRTLNVVSTPHPAAFRAALAGKLGGDQPQRSWYLEFFRQPEVPEQTLLADDAAGLRNIYGNLAGPIVEEYMRFFTEPDALTAGLNYYRATSFTSAPEVEPIVSPTLYVWSTADVALGREAAEATVQYVRGPYRFEVLEGTSHWVPEEASHDLNRLLVEHLAAHP